MAPRPAHSRAARRRRRIVAAPSAVSPTEIQRGFSSDRCGLCLVCVYSYCSLESTILLHDGGGGAAVAVAAEYTGWFEEGWPNLFRVGKTSVECSIETQVQVHRVDRQFQFSSVKFSQSLAADPPYCGPP